jgi:6-phosphogluconolactonase (cycloisomerase 2 family)
MINKGLQQLIFFLTLIFSQLVTAQSEKSYLFVGTYTDGLADKGIYIYDFNTVTGDLTLVSTAANVVNPSFLTLSSKGNTIYACTETKLPHSGSVSAFKFDSISGAISFINKQDSGGENPVYLTRTLNDEFVINANYSAGSVSVFETRADGGLQPFHQLMQFQGNSLHPRRQEKAHIHAAVFSPDYEYIFFPDLGADKIRAFKFDNKKKNPLKALDSCDYSTVPGSGPRHFTFHPNEKFAYCIEELSGTITAMHYESGKLDSIQRVFSYSKLQEEYNSADIHISPDGLYLYASNRWDNENTISIFKIDTASGRLRLQGHQSTFGDHPRNFTLDPTGKFLIVANQVTNNIVVFRRDTVTGMLSKVGREITVPRPSCVIMRTYGK